MLGPSGAFLQPALSCLGSECCLLRQAGQFGCWIQVKTADGKVKVAKCLIDNGSEVNLVSKGFLQDDEAKISATRVQLEGVSGHRLGGGKREGDFAMKLVKRSVWSMEEVKEQWLSG